MTLMCSSEGRIIGHDRAGDDGCSASRPQNAAAVTLGVVRFLQRKAESSDEASTNSRLDVTFN